MPARLALSRSVAPIMCRLRLHRQPGGDVVEDGALSTNGRVAGTYVHGLFDDARFCRSLVAELRRVKTCRGSLAWS